MENSHTSALSSEEKEEKDKTKLNVDYKTHNINFDTSHI